MGQHAPRFGRSSNGSLLNFSPRDEVVRRPAASKRSSSPPCVARVGTSGRKYLWSSRRRLLKSAVAFAQPLQKETFGLLLCCARLCFHLPELSKGVTCGSLWRNGLVGSVGPAETFRRQTLLPAPRRNSGTSSFHPAFPVWLSHVSHAAGSRHGFFLCLSSRRVLGGGRGEPGFL